MTNPTATAILTVAGLDALVDALRARDFTVIGPTVRDGAVVHAEITGVADLPRGVGDEQDNAHYRLRKRDDEAVFGYTAPAQSWKSVLFPARELLRGSRDDEPAQDGPYALFGVRSCDLAAIAILDRVLTERAAVDVHYARRRAGTFVVAVACTQPGGTCFCASTGTGPEPGTGYDLCLTELLAGGHRFVVAVGSELGGQVLADVGSAPARPEDLAAGSAAVAAAVDHMGRALDTDGLRDLLYDNAEHPQWDDVATRCLACTNCTLVCPTCFCTSVEDVSALAAPPQRLRVWDSCFTTDFSYLHGGSVRGSTSARYRQWATHKLAAWVDQFGTSGCVGCGRCISWCPAAIDLTAEVAAIRAAPRPVTGPRTAAGTTAPAGTKE